MRIRRRPQPSPSPSPSSFLLLHSDPSTSAAPQQTPRNAERSQERRGLEVDGGGSKEEERRHANVDLGHKSAVARRLALPQDNAAGCVDSPGADLGADDLHRRGLVNGHGGTDWKLDMACTSRLGEQAATVHGPVANGVAAPTLAVKDQKINGSDGSGGAKKRRGPAVLLEGSRCSRVNGRGWRCSQPTLVGYSLCEHHLGKGRMRAATAAAAAGGGRGGPGQLGRTEHRARIPVSIGAVTTAAAKSDEPGLGSY
ncbi:uncharacterized protein [Lolium perenne]|uniref:uncharacterized protein n=1 Tax=Lolium perenne TaxID=4522 RepID=UPI0021EA7B9C|nr:GRF-interacting factor 10-like [Lolium perenne]